MSDVAARSQRNMPYHARDDAFVDHFHETSSENFIYCISRRKIDVLNNVCTINESSIYAQARLSPMVKRRNSRNAPIALGRLLVDITRTFFLRFSLSSCVSKALTTRRASDGSVPAIAPARAAVKDSTSSGQHCQVLDLLAAEFKVVTDQNNYKSFLVFHHIVDHAEEALH